MSTETQTAACGRCRFYHDDQKECRLHGPIFNDACGSIFPQNLAPTDWCGEFHARDGFGWRYPNDEVREPEECPF